MMLFTDRPTSRWEVCSFEDLDADDWWGIKAYDAEDAAERWAEREDYEDGIYYADGNVGLVAVRKDNQSSVQIFEVSGFISYDYTAKEIEKQGDD